MDNPSGPGVWERRAPYFFDESSKSWTETVARNANLGILVVLEKNGFDIKEVMISLK